MNHPFGKFSKRPRGVGALLSIALLVLSFLNASPSIAEEVTPISPHQGLWQTWTVTPGSLLRPLDPSGGTPFAIDNTVGNHGIDQNFSSGDLLVAANAAPGQASPAVKLGYNGSCPVWSDHPNYAQYSYHLTNGASLPEGVSLSCDGFLIGTVSLGTYSTQIAICDSASLCSTVSISINVVPTSSFQWNPGMVSLPSVWALGTTLPPLGLILNSYLVNAIGAVTFSCVGLLPAGINCDSSNAISGTFAHLGSSDFELIATSGGYTSRIWATLDVCITATECTSQQAALDLASRAPTITAGEMNSSVATIPTGVPSATIPATTYLPATTMLFSGVAPTSVILAPVAVNPAPASATPFTLSPTTKIVDISITGTITAPVTVCLDGASTDHLFHYTGGSWVELPSRSYVNGQVCGVTTSFSPFAAAAPAALIATPVPDPVQQSKITALSLSSAIAGTPTPVVISGSFIEKISAIQINGVALAAGSWSQTQTSVTFTMPGKSAGTYQIQIYNGSAPVMKVQNFTFTAPIVVVAPTPAPTVKQKVTYIRCAKPGHGTRIAYGVNPTCPAGYVKK